MEGRGRRAARRAATAGVVALLLAIAVPATGQEAAEVAFADRDADGNTPVLALTAGETLDAGVAVIVVSDAAVPVSIEAARVTLVPPAEEYVDVEFPPQIDAQGEAVLVLKTATGVAPLAAGTYAGVLAVEVSAGGQTASIRRPVTLTVSGDATAEKGTVTFADAAALAITLDEIPEPGVLVVVRNGSGATVAMESASIDLPQLDGEQPLAVTIVGATDDGSAPIAPKDAGSLVITATGQVPAPGTYEGTLDVAAGPDALLRTVKVTVPAVQPAVAKWTMREWTFWPDELAGDLRNTGIPLEEGASGSQLTAPIGEPLGTLLRDDGRAVVVFRDLGDGEAIPLAKDGELPVLPVRIVGGKDAGKYVGTIDLTPDEEGGEVELTVVYKHVVLGAILALGLGVAAGLAITRLLGVKLRIDRHKAQLNRKLKALEENAAKLPGTYEQLDGGEIRKTADALRKNAVATVAALEKRLTDLKPAKGFSLPTDDPEYAKLLKDIEAFETQVAAWGLLAAELAKLDTVLDAASTHMAQHVDTYRPYLPRLDDDGEPQLAPPDVPVFLATAKRLKGPAKLADVAAQRKKVAAAVALADVKSGWVKLAQELLVRKLWLDAIVTDLAGELSWPERRSIRDTEVLIREVQWDMWVAADAKELEALDVAKDLAEIERNLARINRPPPPPPIPEITDEELAELVAAVATNTGWARTSEELRDAMMQLGLAVEDRGSLPGHLAAATAPPPPPDPGAKAREIELRSRAAAGMAFGVVLAVALFIGLEELYLDEPFGTFQDYAKAFVWGAGATTVLDAVREALTQYRLTTA